MTNLADCTAVDRIQRPCELICRAVVDDTDVIDIGTIYYHFD